MSITGIFSPPPVMKRMLAVLKPASSGDCVIAFSIALTIAGASQTLVGRSRSMVASRSGTSKRGRITRLPPTHQVPMPGRSNAPTWYIGPAISRAVRRADAELGDVPDRLPVEVPVGDRHALGVRGRPRAVHEPVQVRLADIGGRNGRAAVRAEERLVPDAARARALALVDHTTVHGEVSRPPMAATGAAKPGSVTIATAPACRMMYSSRARPAAR